jgi:hypothetical protein
LIGAERGGEIQFKGSSPGQTERPRWAFTFSGAVDVERGRPWKQTPSVVMDVEVPVGAADVDHGRLAQTLLKQADERPGEGASKNIGQRGCLQERLACFPGGQPSS